MGIEIEKSSIFYYAIERQNLVEVEVVDRIVKRNGQVVPYDGAKIILAIEKSFLSVNESVDQTYLCYTKSQPHWPHKATHIFPLEE